MRSILGRLTAAAVMGGIPLVAHVLLTPEVWPKGTLDVLYVMSALGAGSGLRLGGGLNASVRDWARLVVSHAAGSTLLVVAFSVGLSAIFGEGLLVTGTQRVIFGVAALSAAAVVAELVVITRRGFPSRPDPDRDTRSEAIRENVRREIAEIERQAREG